MFTTWYGERLKNACLPTKYMFGFQYSGSGANLVIVGVVKFGIMTHRDLMNQIRISDFHRSVPVLPCCDLGGATEVSESVSTTRCTSFGFSLTQEKSTTKNKPNVFAKQNRTNICTWFDFPVPSSFVCFDGIYVDVYFQGFQRSGW